jgi:hypothetical protein
MIANSVCQATQERHNTIVKEFHSYLGEKGRVSYFMKADILNFLAVKFTSSASSSAFLEAKTAIMSTLDMTLGTDFSKDPTSH